MTAVTRDDRTDAAPGATPRPAANVPGGRRNLRTALVLLSIALVFFVGVIVNRLFFL